MKKIVFRILLNSSCGLVLIISGAVWSPVFAQKDRESRYLEDLKMTRQDLTEAKSGLSSLKSLYAEKEIQNRQLKLKLDSVSENLRRCQDSLDQINKEKEILAVQQNKLSLQLKQSETEKFIYQQKNQILANCSGENEAKTRELIALRNSCAGDKKDFLNKVQNNEIKLNEVTRERDILAQKKSELEIKYSVLSQQLSEIKDQQIGCLEEKQDLANQMQALEREVDVLRKNLAKAENDSKDLQKAGLKIKQQEGFEQELMQLRRRYAQMESDYKLSEEENRKLTDIASKYDRQDNLRQDLAILKGKLSDAVNDNQRLKDIAEKYEKQEILKTELNNLRSALVKSEEQKSQIQQVCDKVRKQEEELEAKFLDLTKKLAALQEEKKKLEAVSWKLADEKVIRDELSGLRQELSACQKEKKQLEQGSLRSRQETDDNNSDLVKLRQRADFLESENKRLLESVSKSRTNGAVLQEASILKEELYQLKLENKALKSRTEKDKLLIEATPAEVIEMRKSLACLESERDNLKSEIQRFKKQQEDLVAQFAGLKKEPVAVKMAPIHKAGQENNVSQLKEDLQATQELSFQLVQEKAGYQKREKETNQVLLDTQNRKAVLEQERDELLKKNKELQAEYAKLSEQVARVMVQYSELEKDKQTTALKSQGCQQELKFMQDKLKSSEQLAASLHIEVENLKKTNKDLEVQVFNAKVQKEQEVALVKAQLEQFNALKEGEYVQLNNRFQEYRAQKEMESKGANDNIVKLKLELQNSQELSFQMVQEKTSFQSQQKQVIDQLKELQSQKALLAQQKQDLEAQNVFLKNQYVASSQELDTVKKEVVRFSKDKGQVVPEGYRKELEILKNQMAEKERDYQKVIKEYESKYKDITSLDKDKGVLIDELAKLKNDNEELKRKFELSEKSRKDLEAIKNRYGKLPEENANLHYNLGVIYAQNQEYPRAVAELEKVIQLKPNDAETYYNLGVINGEYLGNRKKSVVFFEKYLALAPNDAEADRIRKYVLTWKTLGQEPNDK